MTKISSHISFMLLIVTRKLNKKLNEKNCMWWMGGFYCAMTQCWALNKYAHITRLTPKELISQCVLKTFLHLAIFSLSLSLSPPMLLHKACINNKVLWNSRSLTRLSSDFVNIRKHFRVCRFVWWLTTWGIFHSFDKTKKKT